MKNLKSNHIASHKLAQWRQPSWRWLVAVVVLVLVMAAIWLLIAYLAWGRHTDEVSSSQQAITSLTRATFSHDNLSAEGIEAYAATLDEHRADMCSLGVLEQSYTSISPAAKESHDSCSQMAQSYDQLAQALDEATSYWQADHSLAEVLEATKADLDKLEPADYEAYLKRWQQASRSIEQLEVGKKYQPATQAALEAVQAVAEAYQSLIDANKAQKRPAFDDAIIDLQNSYAKLRDSQEVVRSVEEPILEELSQLATELH